MTATETVTFSNPRLRAEFDDWPLGGTKRGRCVFQVHHDKRGYRCSRTTTGKPKYTTYSGVSAIYDGSDGRTYFLAKASLYDFISIYRHDFMCADKLGRDHTVHESSEPEYFAQLLHQLVAVAGGLAIGAERPVR